VKWVPGEMQTLIRDFIMEHPKCNVWSDMGSGKTSATLTAADIMWLAGSQFHPLLVLAPRRVARSVWPGECTKWDHLNGLTVSPIIGNPAERISALIKPADVYTMNYENLEWLVDVTDGQNRWPFKWVIADESTHLKGFRIRHGGKRAAALSKVAKLVHRWVNLTGTPLPNGYIDLWGQNYFIDQGAALGRTFGAFKARWFKEDVYAKTITPHAHSGEQIMQLMAPNTISLRAQDWFDFEDPIPIPVMFDLNRKSRRIYNDMENDMFAELGDDITVEAMANSAVSMKCCQIASGAVFHDDGKTWSEVHDSKIGCLKEIVGETCGQPLLVGYYFKHDLIRLKKAFPHARQLITKQDEDDWNAGKISMLLAHPASMGHGLNLQDGGCIAVFFSQTWNLEHIQQFIERIGPVRQIQSGHPRPVLVYYIMARDTTDEIMYARTQSKAQTQDAARALVNRRRAA